MLTFINIKCVFIVCVILIINSRAEENSTNITEFFSKIQERANNNDSGHRIKLIFPLLLRISARLAIAIPLIGATAFLLFMLVTFAKKAFVLSLAAFAFLVMEKYKKTSYSGGGEGKHVYLSPPKEYPPQKVYVKKEYIPKKVILPENDYLDPLDFYMQNHQDVHKLPPKFITTVEPFHRKIWLTRNDNVHNLIDKNYLVYD